MGFQKGNKAAKKKQVQPIAVSDPAAVAVEEIKVTVSSGNVFQDLGLPNAEQLLANSNKSIAASVAKFAPKPPRVPVGLRNPMAIREDLDPRFNYRNVRGTRGRVEKFLAGGYELVEGDFKIGDPNIAKASGMGSAVSIPSGDNEDRVYLMRIPKEFYDEDQAAKAAKIDEVEKQIKQRPKDEGLTGEIKLNR